MDLDCSNQGYREEIIWRSAKAEPTLEWQIRSDDLSFAPADAGEVEILAAGKSLGTFPAPILYDSSAEVQESVATYVLEDLGERHMASSRRGGSCLLGEGDLSDRRGSPAADRRPHRGARHLRGTCERNGSFEDSGQLRISGNSGQQRRSYLRFNIENLQKDDRLVYYADGSVHALLAGTVASIEPGESPRSTLRWWIGTSYVRNRAPRTTRRFHGLERLATCGAFAASSPTTSRATVLPQQHLRRRSHARLRLIVAQPDEYDAHPFYTIKVLRVERIADLLGDELGHLQERDLRERSARRRATSGWGVPPRTGEMGEEPPRGRY